jgi:hypothetical protein
MQESGGFLVGIRVLGGVESEGYQPHDSLVAALVRESGYLGDDSILCCLIGVRCT